MFTKGKKATIDFDNLMVPDARETFFNKRIISSSYATKRKRPHLSGQLKSAAQSTTRLSHAVGRVSSVQFH
jgi:hypothetical protein